MIGTVRLSLVMLLVFIAHATARADIILNRTPTTINIPLGQSTSITVTWLITATVCVGTGTVSSPSGAIQIVQRSPVVVAGGLSRPISNPGPTVQITETVFIPQTIAIQALNSGLSSVPYSRTFTSSIGCTSTSASASVNLPITSSSAVGFSISRIALTFDNGAPARIIQLRESLKANAEINFNGSGLLQGVWEVAGPASTSGEPMFRPLSLVRQFLLGANKQNLTSPVLPSDSAGLYLLRLRITDPAVSFDAPVIRYFVADERAAGRMPVSSMILLTPPHQSLLAPDTVFAWDTIRGARAYQLEFYAKPRSPGDSLPDLGGSIDTAPPTLPATPPVTGMLVPGAQARAILSAAARSHLNPGQSYLWRVLAIGRDGSVVGESPLRELRMP